MSTATDLRHAPSAGTTLVGTASAGASPLATRLGLTDPLTLPLALLAAFDVVALVVLAIGVTFGWLAAAVAIGVCAFALVVAAVTGGTRTPSSARA